MIIVAFTKKIACTGNAESKVNRAGNFGVLARRTSSAVPPYDAPVDRGPAAVQVTSEGRG